MDLNNDEEGETQVIDDSTDLALLHLLAAKSSPIKASVKETMFLQQSKSMLTLSSSMVEQQVEQIEEMVVVRMESQASFNGDLETQFTMKSRASLGGGGAELSAVGESTENAEVAEEDGRIEGESIAVGEEGIDNTTIAAMEDTIEEDELSIQEQAKPSTLSQMSELFDELGQTSSPAVAQHLLARVGSPLVRSNEVIGAPLSNTDSDSRRSQLVSPVRNGGAIGVEGVSVNSWNSTLGPETSTPAVSTFAPPKPLTAARSLPSVDLLPTLTRPVYRPSSTSPPAKAFYQSTSDAAAMRVKQPKPTKKRSDFSDESDQSGEEEEEEDGEDVTEKMPEEEEEDELMEDVVGVAEVPQPTSSESLPVGLNRTQLLDSLNPSTATTSTFPPGRQPAPRSSAQLEFDTQSIAGMTQLEEVDADPTSLSGIGDMPSSYEQPSQLQFEMTQLDTYADREESASHRDTIARQLPDFAHESNPTTRSVVAPPGRELRRIPPPPPTPDITAALRDETRAAIEDDDNEDSIRSRQIIPSSTASVSVAVATTTKDRHATPTRFEPSSSSLVPPARSSDSSNYIVPDSEGFPTQVVTQHRRVSSPIDATMLEVEAEEEEVVAPSRVEKGKGKATEARPDRSPSPSPPTIVERTSKSKSPVKPSVVIDKSATTTLKGKGKASGPVESSPDQLDFLQQQLTTVDDTFDADVMQETNYDDLPGPHNVTVSATTTRRKRGGSDVSSASVVSNYGTRGVSKRKVSATVDEGIKIAENVAKRLKTGSKKSSTAAPTTTNGTKSKKKGGANGSKGFMSKVGAIIGKVSGSKKKLGSVEPTAGSSRLRSVAQYNDDDTDEDEEMEVIEEPSVVKSIGRTASKKLPSTLPFTRVFARWPTDSWFYPGTIVGIAGSGARILFDDESKGAFDFSELRRLHLVRGDYVRYRGDGTTANTESQMETQAADVDLSDDVRVLRVEEASTGNDKVGDLKCKDMVVTTVKSLPLEQQELATNKGRMTLDSIAIPDTHAAQLDDRKLTAADIARFRGQTPSATGPLTLLSVPIHRATTSLKINKKPGSLFEGIAFITTQISIDSPPSPSKKTAKATSAQDIVADKAAYAQLLTSNGATIINPEDLFKIESTDPLQIDFSTEAFEGISTILLLADRTSATPKYLIALALEIPCVSKKYVSECIQQNELLDWQRFIIAAGFSQPANAFVMGAQIKSIVKQSFHLGSIAQAHTSDAILSGKSVLITLGKKGKDGVTETAQTIRTILAAAGATRADFVTSIEAGADGTGYDYIVVDKTHSVSRSALKGHEGVCNLEWLKQSLIAGRLLRAERMEEVIP